MKEYAGITRYEGSASSWRYPVIRSANKAGSVVGEGKLSLMSMRPYAVFHYLHKPVDLIMLNTHEHVLTTLPI